ncbi:MAG: hypothetical protein MUC87_00440 [Bacteroidia bacterium]|jgi:hypothetical protein|nr:hypothetical protein [Bacteroidia bacterium]
MTAQEFSYINDRPCRFKLKSGKEFFGVIRETPRGTANYFFTTLSERHKSGMGILINLDDVVGAEVLHEAETKVG